MNKEECYFDKEDTGPVDYKNIEVLKKFMTPHAKMYGREETGLCAQHQRQFTRAVKRARFMGLLPYKST